MRSVAEGTNPIMQAMGSYAWWIAVVVGGLIASYALLKLLQRYA
jgi:hypothetical protein